MKKGKELNQVHDWDSLHCWSPMILSKVTRGQRAYFLKRTGAQSRPCWALACGSLALGISGKPWWWSGALELGCTCSLTPWTEQNNDSANGRNKDAIFFFFFQKLPAKLSLHFLFETDLWEAVGIQALLSFSSNLLLTFYKSALCHLGSTYSNVS